MTRLFVPNPIRTFVISASACTFLYGCASAPQQEDASELRPQPAPQQVADRSFTTESLYALLVAEMAIDRKRYDIALNNYVQQAAATRDPNVTAQATRIARILKAHQPALEMAQLWMELEPNNSDAQLIASAELIEANRLDDALAISEQLLAQDEATAFDAIAVKAADNDLASVTSLLARYESLAARHPQNYQLQLGLSVLLQRAERNDEALVAIKRAQKLEPDNVRAGFQESRILQQMGQQDLALDKLAVLVEENPENIGLRARYARILAGTDIQASREQFTILNKQSPGDRDILFSLALVEMESGHLAEAEEHFLQLLQRGYYQSAAHYHLGMIYDKRQDMAPAMEHLLQVEQGPNYLAAMAKATEILARLNRSQDAIAVLQTQRPQVDPAYREGLYMIESDVLSGTGQMLDAETVLTTGLSEFPDSTRLLYARAMLYSRIDNMSAAEQDLKQILVLTPDNAAALNALGYTLADKTDRLEEAYLYIKRAYELTPDDAAVMDSMGWVQYRLGNLKEAIEQLRAALKAMPDHEIAAHLGEVLWVSGVRDEAREIWRSGLELNPRSAIIRETMQRLKAEM